MKSICIILAFVCTLWGPVKDNFITSLASFDPVKLPECGYTKDEVGKLLGKPTIVQGPGGPMFVPVRFVKEWSYFNNPTDKYGRDPNTHWIYSIQFGSDERVVKVEKTVDTYEGFNVIVVCDVSKLIFWDKEE